MSQAIIASVCGAGFLFLLIAMGSLRDGVDRSNPTSMSPASHQGAIRLPGHSKQPSGAPTSSAAMPWLILGGLGIGGWILCKVLYRVGLNPDNPHGLKVHEWSYFDLSSNMTKMRSDVVRHFKMPGDDVTAIEQKLARKIGVPFDPPFHKPIQKKILWEFRKVNGSLSKRGKNKLTLELVLSPVTDIEAFTAFCSSIIC